MVKTVDIMGFGVMDFPDDMTDEQIAWDINTDILPNAGDPNPEMVALRPDLFPDIDRGSVSRGIGGGLDRLGRAPEAVGAAVGRSPEELASLKAQMAEEDTSTPYRATLDHATDQFSRGDYTGAASTFFGDVLPQTFGESLPDMGIIGTGAVGGALAGAATPIPGGALIGGIVGGAIAGLPTFFGMNVERQIRENNITDPEQIETVNALGAAALQGGLEVLIYPALGLLPGAGPFLAKLGTRGVSELMRRGAKELSIKGIAGRVTAAAIKGGAVEAVTEVGQQALERLQAGLEVSPTDQLALKEYIEAAVLGGFLGLGFGGVAGGVKTPLVGRDLRRTYNLLDEKNAFQAQRMAGQDYDTAVHQGLILDPDVPQLTDQSLEAETEEFVNASEDEIQMRNDRRLLDEAIERAEKGGTPAQRSTLDQLLRARESLSVTRYSPEELTEEQPNLSAAMTTRMAGRGIYDVDQQTFTLDEIEQIATEGGAPGVDPEVLGAELQSLRNRDQPVRESYKAASPADITALAKDKGLNTGNKAFNALIKHVTGASDLESVSDFQRTVLRDVIAEMPDPGPNAKPRDLFDVRELGFEPGFLKEAVRFIREQTADKTGRSIFRPAALKQHMPYVTDEGLVEMRDEMVRIGVLQPNGKKKGSYTIGHDIPPTPEPSRTMAGDLNTFEVRETPGGKFAVVAQQGEDPAASTDALGPQQESLPLNEPISIHDTEAEAQEQAWGYGQAPAGTSADLRNIRTDPKLYAEHVRNVTGKPIPSTGLNLRIMEALNNIQERRGLTGAGVPLSIVDRMADVFKGTKHAGKDWSNTEGSWWNKTIYLALDAIDPSLSTTTHEEQILQHLKNVLSHEQIHALRETGILSEPDFQILARQAKTRQRVKSRHRPEGRKKWTYLDDVKVSHANENLSEDEMAEEAVAEMFRDWTIDPKSISGKPASLFRRVVEFLKKLVGFMEKQGVRGVSDIFSEIDSGAMAAGFEGKAGVNAGADPLQSIAGPAYQDQGTNKVYRGKKGQTHRDIVVPDNVDRNDLEAGFFTDRGKYMNRWDAYPEAAAEGQLTEAGVSAEAILPMLLSEQLQDFEAPKFSIGSRVFNNMGTSSDLGAAFPTITAYLDEYNEGPVGKKQLLLDALKDPEYTAYQRAIQVAIREQVNSGVVTAYSTKGEKHEFLPQDLAFVGDGVITQMIIKKKGKLIPVRLDESRGTSENANDTRPMRKYKVRVIRAGDRQFKETYQDLMARDQTEARQLSQASVDMNRNVDEMWEPFLDDPNFDEDMKAPKKSIRSARRILSTPEFQDATNLTTPRRGSGINPNMDEGARGQVFISEHEVYPIALYTGYDKRGTGFGRIHIETSAERFGGGGAMGRKLLQFLGDKPIRHGLDDYTVESYIAPGNTKPNKKDYRIIWNDPNDKKNYALGIELDDSHPGVTYASINTFFPMDTAESRIADRSATEDDVAAYRENRDRAPRKSIAPPKKDALGMYSAVEKAVYEMSLPAWKAEEGRARGSDILAKVRKMPVKAEELLWLGIEEYLTMNPGKKFSRAEVAAFVRGNGVTIQEIVATKDGSDSTRSRWGMRVMEGPHENYREIKLTLPEVEGDFVEEAHFKDRNILAFLRVNDRQLDTGSGGTRNTYFIDDLQSDWHQQGRQFGYLDKDALAPDLSQSKLVPDAPFKGDAWVSLGLKRALVDAVEKGYDALAWPNAEVFMERGVPHFDELYRNQYDKKMPSLIKKLTGQKANKVVTGKAPTLVQKMTGEKVPGRNTGYHIVEITPDLKSRIREEGFPRRSIGGEKFTGSRDQGGPQQVGKGPRKDLIDAPKLSIKLTNDRVFGEEDGDEFFAGDQVEAALSAMANNDKNRDTLVYMSPDEFLQMAEQGYRGDSDELTHKLLREGNKFNELPSLKFWHDGEGNAFVSDHDGRHRARNLRGLKKVQQMPVRLTSVLMGADSGSTIRWGQQQDPNSPEYVENKPTTLTGQGNNSRFQMDMPQSVIFPDADAPRKSIAPMTPQQQGVTLIDELYYDAAPPGGFPAKQTWADFGKRLLAKARAAGAPVISSNAHTPQNVEYVSRVMVHEALEALERSDHGATWYKDRLRGAVRVVSLIHPEILTSATARTAFNFALAITSNGQGVAVNTRHAETVYARFKEDGKMPIVGWGKEAGAMKTHFKLWNKSVERLGIEPWMAFLDKELTIRDLKALGFSTSGENMDTRVYGSVIFGPKIGNGFYQNLRGNFAPLTMDRWWMRSWGRWTNTLLVQPTKELKAQRLAKFKEELTPDVAQRFGFRGDISKLTLPRATALAKKMHSADLKAKYFRETTVVQEGGDANKLTSRPAVFLAAQRVTESKDSVLEYPTGGGHRTFMRDAARQALNTLIQRGVNLEAADLQALLWYPEKAFSRKNGVGSATADPTDYQDTFSQLAKQRGHTDAQIEAAIQGGDGQPGRPGDVGGSGTPAGGRSGVREDGARDRDAPRSSIFRLGQTQPLQSRGGTPSAEQAFWDTFTGKNKTILSRIKQEYRRQLMPGGLMPEIAHDLKLWRDNRFRSEDDRVARRLESYERAAKSGYGKRYSALTEAELKQIDDALHGDQSLLDALPGAMRQVVIGMRKDIDFNSGRYVDIIKKDIAALEAKARELRAAGANQDAAGAEIAAKKAETLRDLIIGNDGKYVNRSYRAFNDPNWNKRIPEQVRADAYSYLMQQYGGDTQAVRNMIEHLVMGKGRAFNSLEALIKESTLGAKDLSVLKKRKSIPPELRALMGEYVDPQHNYARTMLKMSRLIWNTEFLNKMLEKGKGVFMFDEANKPAGHTEPIAGANSEILAPLNDLYVTPEVRQALEDAVGSGQKLPEFLQWLVGLNGAVKVGKILYSPPTQVRNLLSATFFAVQGGSMPSMNMIKEAALIVKDQIRANGGDRAKVYRHYIDIGLTHDTPNAGLVQDLMEDSSKLMQGFEYWAEDKTGKNVVQPIASRFKGMHKVISNLYRGGDDVWKIIIFEAQLKDYMAATGMSRVDAEPIVAKRVRDTVPTYSLTGQGMKRLGRFPLVGPFVAFSSEIIRTSYKNLELIKSDWADPQLRPLARKRIVGTIIAHSWAKAAMAGSMALAGMDDDEEEAIRKLGLGPWAKNSDILITGRNKDGQIQYADLSYVDPYNIFGKAVTSIMRDQPWEERFLGAAAELYMPFIQPDIAISGLVEAVNNKKLRSGATVYNDSAPNSEIAAKIAEHLFVSWGPGVMRPLTKIYKALDEQKDYTGRVYDLEMEAAGMFGLKIATFDPKLSLNYRVFDFKDALSNSSRYLAKVASDINPVDQDALLQAFDTANGIRDEAYTDMLQIVNAARRSGLSANDIRKVLKVSNVSKAHISALSRGDEEAPRWKIGRTFLKGSVKRAKLLIDRETSDLIKARRREIRARARQEQ